MIRRPSPYRRGARVLGDPLRRRLRAALYRPINPRVSVAGCWIPQLDETKHFKMIGSTGTGKTTAIHELLAAALERGDRAVIADPDGGYFRRLQRRYRPDTTLNPFERGSVRWDPFAEIRHEYDVDQLASALIPHSEDPSTREWRAYARTLFAAVVRICGAPNGTGLARLWELLTVATADELRPLVAGTPAQPFLEPDNARMLGSIRSVLMSAIAALAHIRLQRARGFSVREWVRSGRGVLFIPYRADQIATLRSVIAAWLRLAIIEALSQPENQDQRLWFVIDELDAIGAIDGLRDALARLRKFGGRCVLGFQSIAQVSSTYGAGDAQTIVENCGTTLILRCSSSENGGTAQFASRLIGEREVSRRQVSRSSDHERVWSLPGGRRSVQVSNQLAIESALMPSEIEQLPDLTGYLKLASSPVWRRIRLRR